MGHSQIFGRLLAWLGPWTNDKRIPDNVVRRTISVAPTNDSEASFDAWLFTPRDRAPQGAFLVSPGLHFAGPADPRLERFLHVLAHCGFAVCAPFLPTFSSLIVKGDVVSELDAAFEVFRKHPCLPPGSRPGLFSISFGSLPILRLACNPKHKDQIGGAILFGGYADLGETLRFACGERNGFTDIPERDPLNLPVVFLNLIDELNQLDEFAFDKSRVVRAWHAYVRESWGHLELKANAAFHALARAHASELSPQERALFLLGCGVEGDALPTCRAAIARAQQRLAALDPRPFLADATCPLVAIHGSDDDVIPFTQLQSLEDAAPSQIDLRTFRTGLYHHSGLGGVMELFQQGPALLREGATLLKMVRAIVSTGTVTDKT